MDEDKDTARNTGLWPPKPRFIPQSGKQVLIALVQIVVGILACIGLWDILH